MTGPEPIPLSGRQVDLVKAADMIPMPSVTALRMWLSRRKALFPGRYRRVDGDQRRVLWESEVAAIQRMLVKTIPPERWSRNLRRRCKRS